MHLLKIKNVCNSFAQSQPKLLQPSQKLIWSIRIKKKKVNFASMKQKFMQTNVIK